jgi:GT2 family glycosyltransferase
MFSEDIDMSTRIRKAGFTIGLIHDAPVYHKRRVDFRKFMRQVYVFGMSRITLYLLYPESLKLVHMLPAVAVVGAILLLALGLFVSPWFILPLALYLLAIWVAALVSTHSLEIATLAVPASIIQLGGYGCGFIKAYFTKILLGRGRNVAEEIDMRRGK